MNVSKNQLCDPLIQEPGENLILDVQDITESPADEPVTLAEAKEYAKIDFDDENALITEFIVSAREVLEKYLGVSITGKTLKVLLNNSLGGIELPYGPVISVTSVTDSEGEAVAADDYKVQGFLFKTLETPVQNLLTVIYEAGYETIPSALITAIKAQVSYMYEHRGDETDSALKELSPAAKSLCIRHRRVANEFFL